jgi:hypothetical protein
MPNRCRLCTTNDRRGLIEEMATDMWAQRRWVEVEQPWEAAGEYWQSAMRQFAEAALRTLEQGHALHS